MKRLSLLPTLPGFLLTSLLVFFAATPGYLFAQSFTDVTSAQGISHDYGYTRIGGTINQAGGVTFYDYDEDGRDDLCWSSEQGDSLYILRNTGSGFVPDLVGAFPKDTLESKTMQWVDYDNDGDRDFFVSNYIGSPHLYRNNGNGTFADVTFISGITTQAINAFTSVWGDYDKDGDLDLYIANYEFVPSGYNILYRNNGNGTFTDVTLAAGVHDPNRPALAAVFFDYDKDGWPDLYVANDRDRRNSLYRNMGNGTFQDISVASNTDMLMWSMGCAVGDWDNNGYLDLYVTNGPWGNRLLSNNGNGTFTEEGNTLGIGVGKFGWGANFFDADNDGDLDLYAVATQDTINADKARNNFFRNNGNGTWTELFNIGLEDSLNTCGTAIGDFDNDGYYDIATLGGNGDGSKLYRNNSSGNNWVKLSLEGTVSNRDGIGSWIQVITANHNYVRYTHCGISFASQNSDTEILGIGTDAKIDTLIVSWLSGIEDTLIDVSPGSNIHLLEGSTAMSVNGTAFPSSCNGSNDGSINVSANGGPTGNYTYNWSPTPPVGQGTASVSGLSPGTYTVTVTDGSVQTSESFIITEPSAITTSLNITNPTCRGPANGFIDLTVSGGSPGYTYFWSHGPNLQDAQFLDSGRYVVTVMDTNGCTVQDSADLVYSNPLSLSFTSTSVSCHGGTDGSANMTVNGGNSPFIYSWSSGDTIEDPTSLPGGFQLVVVIDIDGCIVVDSVIISEPPPILLNFQPTDPLCHNGATGSIDLSVSGGTPGYAYAWSNGFGQQDPTGLVAGTYSVLVSDNNNCTLLDSVSLVDPAALTLTLTAFNVSCFGGTDGGVDLGPGGGVGAYSYSWSNGTMGQDIMNVGAGTYAITLTDANGCSETDSATVNEPPAIVLSSVVDSVTCNGGMDGSIDMMVSGGTPGYAFSWSHGPTSTLVTGLLSGTYVFTVTDSLNCTEVETLQVGEPLPLTAPMITVAGDTFTSSPAFGYQWYQDGNLINGATAQSYVASVAGDYHVVISDANGCTANSDTISFVTDRSFGLEVKSVRVFPNPGSGMFYVDGVNGSGEVQMEVWNAMGQRVMIQGADLRGSEPLVVDLRDQAVGMYWLRIQVNGKVAAFRLVKE